MKIFQLDCSVNDFNESQTRQHTKILVEKLTLKYPNSELYYLDLVKEQIPFITKEYQIAMFKPEKDRTDFDKAILSTYNIQPFLEADVYVIGVPGYLLNVPAIFKNWLEHSFRIDATVSQSWEGLLKDKRVYIVSEWGGIYTDTRIESTFEASIKNCFKIFGIENITFLNIFYDKETNLNNISQIRESLDLVI
ncbi:MAG: NAD(P)H-dependent oxidoreductase [Alphaproteobacteria bacterium]|nr:NAD(P)H-dependent oxidoreductase [Alphaproteobacteria bacterium]